jgi:hypothetical protein
MVAVALASLTPGADWANTFRPASELFMSGQNPYEISTLFNPPWLLLPLGVAALLPATLGQSLLFWLGMQSYMFVTLRLGGQQRTGALLFAYPGTLSGLLLGNVDWLVVLGVVLPARWGLFLVLIKPQLGVGLALLWLVEAWRAGGWRQVASTFAPVTVAFLLSFALYGLWPFRPLVAGSVPLVDTHWNGSLFPYSIPIGILFAALVLWRGHRGAAIAFGPAVAPYLASPSWTFLLLTLVRHPAVLAFVVGMAWLIRLTHF